MPASEHRPKVARCVQHVMDGHTGKSGETTGGKDKAAAIRICQASLGESYRIPKAERALAKKGGKPLKKLRKEQAQTKAAKIAARREKMGWNSIANLIGTLNGFCPTGKGGGQDNSCSSLSEGRKRFAPGKSLKKAYGAAQRSTTGKAQGYLQRRAKTLGGSTSAAMSATKRAGYSVGTVEAKAAAHTKAKTLHDAAMQEQISSGNYEAAVAHEAMSAHHESQRRLNASRSSDKPTKEQKSIAGKQARLRAKDRETKLAAERQSLGITEKPPKITSRQEGGDDGFQHVIRVDGRSFVAGVSTREVPYYKEQAYRQWLEKATERAKKTTNGLLTILNSDTPEALTIEAGTDVVARSKVLDWVRKRARSKKGQ